MSTPLNNSVLKGFSILSLFSDERPEITVAIVSEKLGLNTATAHRFLATLEAAGVLLCHERGRYSLGLRLSELGSLAQRISPFVAIIQPAIDAVAKELNESVMAARLDHDKVVCIATAEPRRPISVYIKIGTALELHASAQGKLWLAHMKRDELERQLESQPMRRFSDATIVSRNTLLSELEHVREQGYATNLGEREPDIAAVAVPVKMQSGRLLLTLSAFGIRHRFDHSLIERSHYLLKKASAEIERKLYYRH